MIRAEVVEMSFEVAEDDAMQAKISEWLDVQQEEQQELLLLLAADLCAPPPPEI